MDYIEKPVHMQKGFTLVEILIAAALVMVLGGIITYSTRGILDRSKKNATIASMRGIKDMIDHYYEDVGEYPATLRDLVKKPADEKFAANWDGPYIKTKNNEEPKDGWKNPFVYNVTEGGGDHPYELYSRGKNGKAAPKSEWIDAWKQ